MSQERNADLAGQHRLFHAMVLMGGSIALGCGGMSAGTADDDSGSGGTGSLSGAGTGGAPGTGGTASTSGGTSGGGTGGVILLPPDAGSSVDPDPPDCPPAQWSCSDDALTCFSDTYGLPVDCSCDATRPLAPSDCPAGSIFACHAGSRAPDGTPLPQLVPFSCSCVPNSQNCDAECAEAAPSSGTCTDLHGANGRSVLCNCAVIVLR